MSGEREHAVETQFRHIQSFMSEIKEIVITSAVICVTCVGNDK